MTGAEIPLAMAMLGGGEAAASIPLIGAEIGAGGSAAAGLGLGGAGGASSALLQALGGMGPEQAGILAAQNAGFGPTGLAQTLASANPGSASFDALGRLTNFAQPVANRLGRGAAAYQKANAAMEAAGLGRPKPLAPPVPVRPPSGGPPTLSSEIFGRQGLLNPQVPSGGALSNGGRIPPQVLQMLLQQMMRGG
jgi:hypothetical protein